MTNCEAFNPQELYVQLLRDVRERESTNIQGPRYRRRRYFGLRTGAQQTVPKFLYRRYQFRCISLRKIKAVHPVVFANTKLENISKDKVAEVRGM